ncbi:unnamed protein product [Durusdinium trenchii]|uniref:Endoplasmic reticulum vesicle transporter C-terminal domain-containing protein n=1 Tax=Durusdinium trenchii TaxID=1381693 RepID=A0ABP0RM91_9DINO
MLDVFDTSQQTSLPHRTLDADVLVDHALPAIFIMVEVRVLLDVTIHDFPCIDLSLDYQDVSPSAKKRAFLPRFSAVFASEIDLPVEIEAMGNRQTDIRTGVSKQRLKADGTPVGEDCYGALPDGECCNTCSDVLYAYRMKRWALPRIESIKQCQQDGTAKSAYQPPQIAHIKDYSSDDYLNNFKRIGSMTPSGNEARITAPLKLNLSLNLQNITFKPLNLKPLGSPLSLDFDDWDDEEFEGESSRQKDKVLSWPSCVRRNVVVNGYDIDAAVFEDLTPFGAKEGCWKDNCLRSDKFNCDSMDHCATVCSQVPKCSWWTWGVEEFAAKCWLRTGTSRKSKRYGFSSGTRNCTVALKTATTTPAADGASEVEALKARRLSSFDDLPQGWDLPLGSMLHMPIFEWRDKESELRREMKGESCRIHGYFDVNRVPGNFHIGVHGAMVPSYLSFYDEPAPPQQNMRHTINSLAFIDVPYKSGGMSRPLDGFESPKAFTFQYYLMITPVTRKTRAVEWGYQFKAASFVTNELIGPAVFFRMDFDPIRVTYFTEHVPFSKFLVNACAVVGGCIAMSTMLLKILDAIIEEE